MASAPLELVDVDLDFSGTPIQGPAGPQGKEGPAGADGKDGKDGTNGINGINGQDGRDGANGADGKDGVDGHDGIDGEDGLTAYELWLEAGNAGTVMDFLASLVGPKGDKGDTGADSTVPGPKGDPGIQGIQGPKGDTGNDGQDGTDGADGLSAYQVAVANGFVGTEAQWLASLKGAKGDTGTQGIQGVKGDKGDKGEAGTGLNNKGDWVAATYQPGDYVFAAGTTASTSMWILRGTAAYASASEPNTDLAHWIEFEAPAGQDGADGTDGTNGREIELNNDGTNIRWRYVGETTWNILVALTTITGPKGDTGAKGDKGDTGNAGAAGTNGKTILSGTVVPDGTVGTDGDLYLNRTTNLFYGPKAAGAWPAGFSIVGAKGDTGNAGTAGTNGNTVLTVSGTPAAGVGVNGDYAYNPATWTIYGPKSGGAWPAGTVLKGTKGTDGKGVSSGVVTYQAHTSGTTAPTGTWSSTVPTVTKGQYLWTRTVTTYTDSTTTTAYSVAYQGADGTGGGGSLPVGGTTGQVLTKISDTDGDAGWATLTGGGGGADPAVLRAIKTTPTVIQTLVPIVLVTVPLLGGHAYMVRFRAQLNDNSNSKAIKFGVGNISKQDMALRCVYQNAAGVFDQQTITEGIDTGDTAAAVANFLGSYKNGPGNLLTIDGHLTTSGSIATSLKIMVWNGDSQYDYRQLVTGAMIEVIDYGAVTLS